MELSNLEYDFAELDIQLIRLAMSHSTIEYTQHVREEFNNVINQLNEIKQKMELSLHMESNDYFANYDGYI